MIARRGILAGLGALLAAPAIIRTPGLLMPVRPIREPLVVGVDVGKEPSVSRWVFITTPNGAERSFQYDWFVRLADSRGAAVERRIVDGKIEGFQPTFIAMDEASEISNEVWHDLSSRERTGVTDETQGKPTFGDWPVWNSKFRG